MKKTLIFLLIVFISFVARAQTIELNSVTGTTASLEVINSVAGYENGFLIAGAERKIDENYKGTFLCTNQHFYLAEVNGRGKKTIVTKNLIGEARVVVRTPDEGILVAGISFSPEDSSRYHELCYLAKFDKSLNKTWEKLYSIEADLNTMISTADNGALIVYASNKIIRFSATGEFMWENNLDFGCGWGSNIRSVCENADGTFLLAGNSGGFYNQKKMSIALIDSTGNLLWKKCFDNYTNAYIASAVCKTDNGYLLAGEVSNKMNIDLIVMCIDDKGNELWNKQFDNDVFDKANAIIATNDGNYLLAGSTYVKSKEETDGWVIKMNPKGEKIWAKVIDGKLFDVFTSCDQINDKYYALGGYSMEIKAGEIWNLDMWIVKLKDK